MNRRWFACAGAVAASVLAIALWTMSRRGPIAEARLAGTRPTNVEGDLPAMVGREGVDLQSDSAVVRLPETRRVPASREELHELMAWMRGLGPDELRRLSNADFDFRESELLALLQRMEGPWVVSELGNLAIEEGDPLLKAILVEGLVNRCPSERYDSADLYPVLRQLVSQVSLASEDPHKVADGLVTMAFMAGLGGNGDYPGLVKDVLAVSDNGGLLIHGYLFLGQMPGSDGDLEQALMGHLSPEGRMGALEGLREAAMSGRISPETTTSLALTALEAETNARNRTLLYEMMISAGGEAGLGAAEEIVRSGALPELLDTIEMFAMQAEPARAMALFQQVLAKRELDGDALAATYRAIGLVPGAEGRDYLLGLAKDGELDPEQRLAGLRGLWNREVDSGLATELQDVFTTTDDTALRTEALRMLAYGEAEGGDVDMRAVATDDRDPLVRAEAVMLAAMTPSDDAREWLEERIHADESMDVKAAAVGALVYHAHYTGDGEQVLDYLTTARRFTRDESALAMIAEGERMVQSYDPRALDLGLEHEAETWATIARYTSGPSKRAFERRAKQLQGLVATLRASGR